MKKKLFFLILLFIPGFCTLSAQDGEIVLSSSDVKSFITSYPSIKTDFEKLGIGYDNDHEITLPEGFEAMNEVNRIVGKHGYADWEDYYSKSAAILLSYAAIKLNVEQGEVQPELQAAIEEIKNNTYYTAEQKEQMIEAIRQGMTALVEASNSMSETGNMDVVQPFVEQLDKLLEE
ncbi:MAG: hypothetical protein JW801_19100 [Bacteroidales bacterium]|nr:hypothetical protein [Bacteroidales bacterium]